MDTYSANSLKLLNKDPEAFRLKYKEGLFLNPDNSSAKAGQNLHSFLCFYLKGFDISKIENSFSKKDREFLDNIKEFDVVKALKNAAKKDIEQPFLIKCVPNLSDLKKNDGKNTFYLTGRFDAVLCYNKRVCGYLNGGAVCGAADDTMDFGVEIYDWKTVNLPKNPKEDVQTLVYLYAASRLYGTENVSIIYVSLSKNESTTICFDRACDYLEKIFEIVQKDV